MKTILETFGVTKELLANGSLYEQLRSSGQLSSLARIKEVLSHFQPISCGVPLIRVGPDRDGGYLVPDDLLGIDACFSPGTNNYKDFEDHLSTRYGIRAFMCDYSSEVEKFRTPLINGLQFFEKKWLDVDKSEINLDINEWVENNSTAGSELILQMDIEGAEYRNLLHISETILSRFRVIVLEIHNLDLLAKAEFLEGVLAPAFAKINKHFSCVHAHPNNCCGETVFGDNLNVPNVLELTFYRKDRFRGLEIPIELPNRLDVLNVPSNPPLHINGFLGENADSLRSEANGLRQTVDWLQQRVQLFSSMLVNFEAAANESIFFMSLVASDKNVARGKAAAQSSSSPDSPSAGAAGATSGIKTGRYGFCTAVEENPWWAVDLGCEHNLEGIVLYNRLDADQENVRTLRILLSSDNRNWRVIYNHNHRPPFGGVVLYCGLPPLLVRLNGMQARFVRINLQEKAALHLDQVEIIGTKVQ